MSPSPDLWTLAIWFAIAVMNLVTVIIAWRTKGIAVNTQGSILMLEQNTNSIKDALVAATARGSRAEGLAAGLAEGRAENAAKAAEEAKPK